MIVFEDEGWWVGVIGAAVGRRRCCCCGCDAESIEYGRGGRASSVEMLSHFFDFIDADVSCTIAPTLMIEVVDGSEKKNIRTYEHSPLRSLENLEPPNSATAHYSHTPPSTSLPDDGYGWPAAPWLVRCFFRTRPCSRPRPCDQSPGSRTH